MATVREETMLGEVEAALEDIEGVGTFAAEETCSADALRLQVERVGALAFPVTAAAARKLRAVARPAPYGLRDQTLHDPSVRDTWEIRKDQIKLDAPTWKRALAPKLALLGARLGLPEEGKLRAVLDKMLVYEPGQFFAPHQDSERSDDMVGTLVVELPSRYTGGGLVIRHGAEEKAFRGAGRRSKDLSLVAFYADCRHEVERLESGHRVVLVFQLRHPGADGAAPGAPVDRLAQAVEAHFATPIAAKYGQAPPSRPDRLIYLLDHEYTSKSLGWDRLKNDDRLRVAALRQVAERLDCEVFLALADVHEVWSCEGDEDYGGYGRHWEDDYDEEDEEDDEDEDDEEDEDDDDEVDEEDGYALIELIDDDVALDHWIDAAGKEVSTLPARPEDGELCSTLDTEDFQPWKSEHEGYTGNAGNTVDRWYHRAAFVMWPRSRAFALRARVSPSWAVKELARVVERGALDEARDKAQSLLSHWGHGAAEEKDEAFFAALLGVLTALGDADLATALLAPFGPHRLTEGAIPAFAALVERLRRPWAERVFTAWTGDSRRYGASRWRSLLPALAAALAPGRHGGPLAAWLLPREVASMIEELQSLTRMSPGPRRDEQGDVTHVEEVVALFGAARVLGDTASRDRLLDSLKALPVLATGALLRACRAGRKPAEVRSLGLGPLHVHLVAALEEAQAAPQRCPGDWSIEPPTGCSCALCQVLAAFLCAPHQREHRWPLAKERRRHVHGVLERAGLPVSHVTEHKGSPHTLVLRKLPALFEREAAVRARQKELLSWLRKERAAFGG